MVCKSIVALALRLEWFELIWHSSGVTPAMVWDGAATYVYKFATYVYMSATYVYRSATYVYKSCTYVAEPKP